MTIQFFMTTVRRAWLWVCVAALVVLVPYWAANLIGSLADTAWADAAICANLLAAVAVIAVAAKEAREQRAASDASDATSQADSPVASAGVNSRSDSARIQARWMNRSALLLVSALILHGVGQWTNQIAFDVVASAALLGTAICFTLVVRTNQRIIGF